MTVKLPSCRLRALDRDFQPHIFLPSDIPVLIWENEFILAQRLDAPPMRLDTIVRMMDHLDVGEGDVVWYNKDVYTVEYSRGFQLCNSSGIVIPSNQVEACDILAYGQKTTSVIQLKNNEQAFRINSLLGVFEGKAFAAHCMKPFDPLELKMSAGFVYMSKKVCYGDIVDGHELIMWRGRPCIVINGAHVEIPTRILLREEF